MQTTASDHYLATEVTTATPQKLQLMLIDGALRFAHQAMHAWREANDEQAGEALVRCQQIVSEVLCGLRPEHDRQLTRKVASIYLYVFRTLTTAHMQRDETLLRDVISVLEIERDTWRQVCQSLPGERTVPAMHAVPAATSTPAMHRAADPPVSESLSFEA